MALRRASATLLARCLAQQVTTGGVVATQRAFTTSAAAQTSVHIEEEVYNRQRQVIPLGNRVPSMAPDAWVAPSAVVVGDVDLYDGVSIWHNVVLRGDLNAIRIGAFSTVLDGTVIHAASSSPTGLSAATRVGHHVTVGQGCLLRSATVGDEAVLGDRSVLMEGSLVEKQAVLAPGTVLPPGRRVPAAELWAGNPARFVRKLSKDELHDLKAVAAHVQPSVAAHAAEFTPESDAYVEADALRAALKPGTALKEAGDLGDGTPQPLAPAHVPRKSDQSYE